MAVLLSPVGGAAAQFLDNNGNPLLAGKLYTYVAGTTTNQATYTSSSGVTPHTNPIILDAGGRVPGGEIWLTDGLQYKFVLKNANDVLIGTYDNLVGINSNFVNFLTETEVQTATAGQTVFTLTTMQYQQGTNNLSVFVDGVNQIDGGSYSYVETSPTVVTFTTGLHVGALVKFTTAQTLSTGVTDASLVTYTPPFTGSVATTVEDKLAQYVNIKDFGAVGDGVTDDTNAFVDCLNSQPSIDGFDVYLPAGTYRIDNSALYFTRRIRFFGNSRETTVLDFSQDNNNIVNAPYNAHIIFVHSNNIAGSSTFANPIQLPVGWVGTYGEMGGLFDIKILCNSSVIQGIGVFYNVAGNSSNILVRDANLHNMVVAALTNNLQTRGGTVGPSGLDIGGNSNNGVYINIKAQFAVNGDGIHVNGADANANLFLHPDASVNDGWGVNDASGLGNTYVQGHTADNAWGAYRSIPASANRSTFVSPYAEGSQGFDNANTYYEMSARAIILGAQGVTPDGNFPAINAENDGLVAHQTLSVMDAADTEDTGGTYGRLGRGLFELRTTDGLKFEIKRESSLYTGMWYGGAYTILFANATNGAIAANKPYFANGFALDPNSSQDARSAAPTTGAWVQGQIVWNTAPTAGGFAGWICTASGTPGTWKTFGAISA